MARIRLQCRSARAEAFIAQALAAMPPDDRAGVVVFGREALVERMPSSERAFGAPAVRPSGNATSIAEALQLGMALLPAEGYRRLVLLSDGGENRGNAREIAQRAAAVGIPIDIVHSVALPMVSMRRLSAWRYHRSRVKVSVCRCASISKAMRLLPDA